jgi:hypothetical protein
MKRIFLTFAAILIFSGIYAQTNPIDALFDKYSDQDGFTSVYISGRMLSMLGGLGKESGNQDNILLRLKSIRIISQDSLSNLKINFYQELSKKLDMSVYEELMVVKEGRDVTKFLTVQKGNTITELLVISGGSGGNSLISIRGDINLKELSSLSKTLGIEELEQLDNAGQKNPGK